MGEKRFILHELAILESLGGVADIYTDKTGTFTTFPVPASEY